jgi:AcrR family transcriptional regulator
MARPSKHDDHTREALLDAAERLLATGGPGAVSIRAVADEISESTRAVYSVLGSKPALLHALAARGFRFLAELVEAIPATDDPAADLVQAGIQGFRRFALERPHLFRISFDQLTREVIEDPGAYRQLLRSFEALRSKVERAVQMGAVEPRPTVEIVFAFHSFCHGLAVNELSRLPPPVGAGFWRFLDKVDGEALWRFGIGAFVNGLSPPPGGLPSARVDPDRRVGG